MPTKNPRINVVLEEPVYAAVKKLSGEYDISMSMLIRDMVKEEIVRYEDMKLSELARTRAKGGKKGLIKHKDIWK